MSKLKTEGLRQLPNSKWLQEVLDSDRYFLQQCYEDDTSIQKICKTGSTDHECDERCKIDLDSCKEYIDMQNNVLSRCANTKEGEPIYLTKEEWDWVSNTIHESYEECSPWRAGEEPDGSAEHTLWLDSYNKYANIIDREQGIFPCDCTGYECRFAYVKIDGEIYNRHTGNIFDGTSNAYRCPECLVSYGCTHHINCGRERCPICLEPQDCDTHSHELINCIHSNNVRYYRGPEDNDGVFEPGFNYRLSNAKNDNR